MRRAIRAIAAVFAFILFLSIIRYFHFIDSINAPPVKEANYSKEEKNEITPLINRPLSDLAKAHRSINWQFDYSQCTKGSKAFFNPKKLPASNDNSPCPSEFYRDYTAFLLNQSWVTQDINEACFVIPDVYTDYLFTGSCADNITEAVLKTPHWFWSAMGPGTNHLLMTIHDFNLDAIKHYYHFPKVSNNMWLSIGFTANEFRRGFDVSNILSISRTERYLTMYFDRFANETFEQFVKRPILASFKGTRYDKDVRTALRLHAHKPDRNVFVYTMCFVQTPQMDDRCNADKKAYDAAPSMEELLPKSQFGLCPRGWGIASYRFIETLLMGAIPVVMADNYVMPYYPEVDWSGCVVRLDEKDANRVVDVLEAINPEERLLRYLECRRLLTMILTNDNQQPPIPSYYKLTWRLWANSFRLLRRRIEQRLI